MEDSMPSMESLSNSDGESTARVLRDFKALSVNELPLKAGDTVTVLEKAGHFWKGRNGNKVGLFPSNYVTIPSDFETKRLSIRSRQDEESDASADTTDHQEDPVSVEWEEQKRRRRNRWLMESRKPRSSHLKIRRAISCNSIRSSRLHSRTSDASADTTDHGESRRGTNGIRRKRIRKQRIKTFTRRGGNKGYQKKHVSSFLYRDDSPSQFCYASADSEGVGEEPIKRKSRKRKLLRERLNLLRKENEFALSQPQERSIKVRPVRNFIYKSNSKSHQPMDVADDT